MPARRALIHVVTVLEGYTGNPVTRFSDLRTAAAERKAEEWVAKGDYMVHVRPALPKEGRWRSSTSTH